MFLTAVAPFATGCAPSLQVNWSVSAGCEYDSIHVIHYTLSITIAGSSHVNFGGPAQAGEHSAVVHAVRAGLHSGGGAEYAYW